MVSYEEQIKNHKLGSFFKVDPETGLVAEDKEVPFKEKQNKLEFKSYWECE